MRRSNHRRETVSSITIAGLSAVASTIVFISVVFPLSYMIYVGFLSKKAFTEEVTFVGLKNYADIFVNSSYLPSESISEVVKNTLIYAVGSTVGQIVVGTGLALLVWSWPKKISKYIGSLLFMPYIIVPSVVAIMIWRYLGDAQAGFITKMSQSLLHFEIQLFSPNMIQATLVMISIWIFAPFTMTLVTARLNQIPPALFESIAVDGGGVCSAFRYLILPHITPTLIAAGILRLMIMATKFDVPYLVLGSGKIGMDQGPVSIYIFEKAYEQAQYGRACAMAVLLCVALLLPVAIAVRYRFGVLSS